MVASTVVLVLLVHLDLAAAGDAALAHAAGYDRRVAGAAAADRQDALRGLHALDILGAGLKTNENDLLLLLALRLGVGRGEDDLAAGGAGGSAQTLAERRRGLEGLGVELRVEQGVEVARVDHQNGLLFIDHALVIMPSSTRSHAILMAACAVRLPLRHCSM